MRVRPQKRDIHPRLSRPIDYIHMWVILRMSMSDSGGVDLQTGVGIYQHVEELIDKRQVCLLNGVAIKGPAASP
jgi:hypothetical protein